MNINNSNDIHNKKKKVNKNVLEFIFFYFLGVFFFSSRAPLDRSKDATRHIKTQERLDFYMTIRHLNLLDEGLGLFASSGGWCLERMRLFFSFLLFWPCVCWMWFVVSPDQLRNLLFIDIFIPLDAEKVGVDRNHTAIPLYISPHVQHPPALSPWCALAVCPYANADRIFSESIKNRLWLFFFKSQVGDFSQYITKPKEKQKNKTRNCRCGRKFLVVEKIVQVSLYFNCFKFENVWIWLFTNRQSCVVQKQAWSAVFLHVSMNPDWEKQKLQDETVSANCIAQE